MALKKRKSNRSPVEEHLSNSILLKIFEQSIETHNQVMAKVQETCEAVKENTKASNELVQAFRTVPIRLDSLDRLMRILRWSLIPIISMLVLVVFGLVFRAKL